MVLHIVIFFFLIFLTTYIYSSKQDFLSTLFFSVWQSEADW